MRILAVLILSLVFLCNSALACTVADLKNIFSQKDLEKAQANGCNVKVIAYANRVNLCEHWDGESGYDEERNNDIQNAKTQLKCSSLVEDYQKLLNHQRNKTNQELLAAFRTNSIYLSALEQESSKTAGKK